MAEIVKTDEQVQITREYVVTGVAPLQLRFRKSQIAPREVSVVFTDGQWQEVAISGGQLRRDGTAGENGFTETYYSRSWGEPYDGLPEWAQPLTEYEED